MMKHPLFGFKHHIVPMPWGLFRRLASHEVAKSSRALGHLDDDQRRVHHLVVRELPGLAKPMSGFCRLQVRYGDQQGGGNYG